MGDWISRNIYHCPFCNLCRVGKGLGIDYFHCMTCNACMSTQLKEHICREKGLESNCPICHDFLFTSNTPVKALPCGHFMHSACFQVSFHFSSSFVCILLSTCVFKLHGLQVQACVSQRVLFTLFIQSLQWILWRLIPSELGQYLLKCLEHRVWGVNGRSSTRANYWIYFQCIAGLHMQPLHMSYLQQVTWRHGCKLHFFSLSCLNACSNLSSANKH
jgi:hypothetical protein